MIDFVYSTGSATSNPDIIAEG